MDSTITQVGLPTVLARRYDELAEETGRGRDSLLAEALEEYLARNAGDDARLDAAIAAADRGELVDAESVDAQAEALLTRLGMTQAQLAAIEAEVRLEADAVYGPCE